MTIHYYYLYVKTSLLSTWLMHKNSILLLSITTGTIMGLMNKIAFNLGVHVMFLFTYIILVFFDVISGITASRVVDKEPFLSSKFIKKALLAGFSMFMLLITEWMIIIFTNHEVHNSKLLPQMLNIIILLTSIIKIMFMLMFVIYELTSIRQNLIRLRLTEFVRVLDLLIVPLNKLDSYLNKKFDSVIENDLNEKINEENTNV